MLCLDRAHKAQPSGRNCFGMSCFTDLPLYPGLLPDFCCIAIARPAKLNGNLDYGRYSPWEHGAPPGEGCQYFLLIPWVHRMPNVRFVDRYNVFNGPHHTEKVRLY